LTSDPPIFTGTDWARVEALTDAEIAAAVAAAIQSSGAKSMADMSKVMAALKPQLAGRADMGKVSASVKAKLSA